MATTITFGPIDDNRPQMRLPQTVTEAISESGTSQVTTAAVVGLSQSVRIATTAAIRVAIGPNPTATSTSALMPANSVEYFGANNGDKVAVITA